MNKRIMSVVMSALLVVVAILFLQDEKVVDAADNIVLLEKRHPGYWDYLRPEKMIEVQTIPGFEEVSTQTILDNNLIDSVYSRSVNGIDIDYDNGTVNISGTAEKNMWPSLFDREDGNALRLEKGTYFVSLGNDDFPENIDLYIEGFKNNQQHGLVNLKEQHYFYIDSSDYDAYRFTLGIEEGGSYNFSMHPVLCKISDEDLIDSSHQFAWWRDVSKAQVTNKDWSFF